MNSSSLIAILFPLLALMSLFLASILFLTPMPLSAQVTGGTSVTDSVPVPLGDIDSTFELGEETPQGWRNINLMLNGSYLWDTETVHSGEKSVAIRGTRYRYGRWRSDKLPVSHNGYSWYTFTGWVKTERNGGEVYLAIAWLDGEGHLITTSDSPMLPTGDSEWQQVSISALPAEGAVSLELWCISNHNGGQTWFDDLALSLLVLPGKSSASYDAFLNDYPTHSLAVDAHRMRLQSIYTQAKWTREKGWADPGEQKKASELFAQAAAIPRLDAVLTQAVPTDRLQSIQQGYEALVDQAFWDAGMCALSGYQDDDARTHLEAIIQRNQTPEMVTKAQKQLEVMDKMPSPGQIPGPAAQ